MAFRFVISILIFATIVYAESPDLLIELFRHGARAPDRATYDTEKYWVNRLGQLTPVGMRMHYVLGASMRERYPDLLSKYDPQKVYVRSTDLDRTLMSAYSHMQGIFQQSGPEIEKNIDLSNLQSESVKEILTGRNALPGKAQSVPIYSLFNAEDHLLRGFHHCERQSQYRKQNMEDPKTISLEKNEMKEVVQYLAGKGIKATDIPGLRDVGEAAISHKFENINLPAGISTDSQFFKDVKFAYEYYYAKAHEGLPIQRTLYAVPILESIVTYIDDFLTGKTPRNAIFLSAHDTTLMSLLAAFNITTADCLVENYRDEKAGKPIKNPHCVYPQYASNVIFEVYKTPEPSIAFYYDGKPINLCDKEGSRCTVKDFVESYVKKVTDGLTMEDFYMTCDSQHPRNQTVGVESKSRRVILQSMGGLTHLEMILMALSIFLSLLIVVNWMNKKREESGESSVDTNQSNELQDIGSSSSNSQVAQQC